MKEPSDVVACVMDYGYFVSLAVRLADEFKTVYYHSPISSEFIDVRKVVYGEGLEKVIRLDDPMEPEIFASIDLFIFPDIGQSGLQAYLREQGKAVWGSFSGTELEMYRTKFLSWVKDLGLPVATYAEVTGLTNLGKFLERCEGKWVKVDRYRCQTETFYHQDWLHTAPILNNLAREFGGTKEQIQFIVQDVIPTSIEIGYDGWTVDGQFPTSSYQGYEGKDEIYLGALREYSQLPKEMVEVNEAIAPTLKELGYRNFIATEIRVAEGKNYFIDPTMRMPGQTGEQLLETCANLGECVWYGANGIVIVPKYLYKYAASATIHYAEGGENDWKLLVVPEKVRQWTKCAHYGIVDDVWWFPPSPSNELGVVIAVGNTIEEVFQQLKKTTEAFSDEPVNFGLHRFFDLLDAIREAEKSGIKFSDGVIPTNKQILEYAI